MRLVMLAAPPAGGGRARHALPRGRGARLQTGCRRRQEAALPIRSPREGEPARPPPPAPAREAQRHPARPVGRGSPRPADRLVPGGLGHHRGPAPDRQGRADRAQPALPRRQGLRRLHRHHRPQGRALVHRRPPTPPDGPPRRAARSLRHREAAQDGVPGVPSARRRERDLQPARLHPRRRQPRRARHQRAARRPADPAPSRRPRERAALLRVRPRHRRRLHGLGEVPRAAAPAHPGARALGCSRSPPRGARAWRRRSARRRPSPAASRRSPSSGRPRWARRRAAPTSPPSPTN